MALRRQGRRFVEKEEIEILNTGKYSGSSD
jgi:hypothetical protein